MTLVREQGSEVITQFNVPIRGTWKNIAAHTVPVDAVYDSLNVFIREGKLRNRPGLSLFDDTIFTEPVLGGSIVVTPSEKVLLAITSQRVYQLSDVTNTWSILNITNEPGLRFAPNNNSVIDMTFMQTSGDYIALIAQESNILKKWVDSPRAVSTLTGTNIPYAKSVCIAASRVVALVAPHKIVWSNVNNPTVFDALAYATRAQSGDKGILVESLSALSFVLYKERSIHIARAQAGLDEGTAFSFNEPIYVDGPAGIYALVNVNGAHIYMTHNGRVATFDGSSYPRWIADGLWFYLQDDIQPGQAHLIRAVYDYRLHTVTFFYPKKNHGPGLKGMLLINLPFEGQDIQEALTTRAFLGLCNKGISHASEKRWDSVDSVDRSILYNVPEDTQDRSQAFLFNERISTDDGEAFTCSFQTGLQAMPDARHTKVTVETFVERGQRYGSLLIEPVISDALETPSGTIPDVSGQFINLENNPIAEYIGFNKIMRFFGLRYTWTSDNYVRYSGAVVYSSSQKRAVRA